MNNTFSSALAKVSFLSDAHESIQNQANMVSPSAQTDLDMLGARFEAYLKSEFLSDQTQYALEQLSNTRKAILSGPLPLDQSAALHERKKIYEEIAYGVFNKRVYEHAVERIHESERAIRRLRDLQDQAAAR